MERDTVWDNAQLLNQFMTNERISFRANDLMLEMLWAAFPVEYEKAASHGDRQKPKFHSHSLLRNALLYERHLHLSPCGRPRIRHERGRYDLHPGKR